RSGARGRRPDRRAQRCGVDGCVRLARGQRGDRHYHQARPIIMDRRILMMTRVIRLAAAVSLAAALPLAAQRAGTIEIGAFARYTDFDNSLGFDNTVGVGARGAVYVRPNLALELDVSRSTGYTPVHARLGATLRLKGGGGGGAQP